MNKQQLEDLVKKINHIIDATREEDSLLFIVEFFKVTSILHDNIDEIHRMRVRQKTWLLPYTQDPEAKKRRSNFCETIVKAGRSDHGWNRTRKGDAVTSDKVFLGNIFGINTKTVSYFESIKHTDKELYNIVCKQSYDFIKSYKGLFSTDFFA